MFIFSRLKMYLLGAATFVAAVAVVYFKGKSAGKEQVENETMRRRVDAMKTQKEIRDEIYDDIDVTSRAQHWVRSDDDKR